MKVRRQLLSGRSRLLVAGLVSGSLLLPGPAASQVGADYRISQRSTVTQKVAGTTIGIDYSRPAVRGRTPVFGSVIHWGEVWTPGANEATVLELSDTVEVEGHTVPAGRWSMWIVPSRVGRWELLLDARDSLFHTQRPEIGADSQIRLPIETRTIDHVELLTWSFPNVSRNTATLELAWHTTAVPLEIRVDAEMPVVTVPPAEAERYTGDWLMTFERSPMPDMPPPPPQTLSLRYDTDHQHVVAEWPPELMAPPEGAAPPPAEASASAQERERAEARRQLAETGADLFDIVLVPRDGQLFLLGFVEQPSGILLDVEHVFHEFEIENGRAVRLTIRGVDDQVFARGVRKP